LSLGFHPDFPPKCHRLGTLAFLHFLTQCIIGFKNTRSFFCNPFFPFFIDPIQFFFGLFSDGDIGGNLHMHDAIVVPEYGPIFVDVPFAREWILAFPGIDTIGLSMCG